MDLTETIAPKSDQLNADDLLAGARTFTIERVNAGTAEQPVNVHLAEMPGRPYKPSKTMRRVLVAIWGKDADVYAGRSLTLYRDPTVKFGGEPLGGIKISHASHIDKPWKGALTSTRGKKAVHTVEPLPTAPAALVVTAEQVAACTDVAELQRLWGVADESLRPVIEARAAEVKAGADGQ